MMTEPHTALFVVPTGVGKTHLALDLIRREYYDHFDFIIVICPALSHAHSVTYESRKSKEALD